MCDYKTLYFKLMAETSNAIDSLIKTQKECEELYINSSATDNMIDFPKSQK